MTHYLPSPREHVREQVALYEATQGRQGNTIRGMPCIIVTHTGRRTGATRKTPLIRVPYQGSYLLVGSFGGHPRDPSWVDNLRADPNITVRDGTEVRPYQARLLNTLEERQPAWDVAVTTYPRYAEYQSRTDRAIPVFLCEPR